MTSPHCPSRTVRSLCNIAARMLLLAAVTLGPANAQQRVDTTPRTAVISAFAPEQVILREALSGMSEHSVNGVDFITGTLEGRDVVLFLSGISVVNASMTTQLALDHFVIDRLVFSGIAGGVDPGLNIGDVVIADRWGQYLEMVFARETDEGWETIPFFEYPHANFGMMFPRSVTVQHPGAEQPETRFWFPVDAPLLAAARRATAGLTLDRCSAEDRCLDRAPEIRVGGSGVSGSAFVDNATFRQWVFETFAAQVLDMESGAVAHVAYANDVPWIAVRSLADLAGGGPGANQMEVFLDLAAQNATTVVRALLRELPTGP